MEPTEIQEESETMGTPASSTSGRGWKSRAGTFVVMGVTAVIIMAVAYMTDKKTASGGGLTSVTLTGRASGPAPKVGKMAPDFTATTVDGTKVSLSKFRGHPVWVTFGASWCQPCRAENPDIQAAYDKYRTKGVVVLAIFIQEDASAVKEYATRVGLTYPKVADTSTKIASSYRILGIPSHFFIDSTGVLRQLRIGSLDPPAMDKAISEVSE